MNSLGKCIDVFSNILSDQKIKQLYSTSDDVSNKAFILQVLDITNKHILLNIDSKLKYDPSQ